MGRRMYIVLKENVTPQEAFSNFQMNGGSISLEQCLELRLFQWDAKFWGTNPKQLKPIPDGMTVVPVQIHEPSGIAQHIADDLFDETKASASFFSIRDRLDDVQLKPFATLSLPHHQQDQEFRDTLVIQNTELVCHLYFENR